MSVAVICDSTAALDPQVAAAHRIVVVPLTVTIRTAAGVVEYADGALSDQELERWAADTPVSTAAPAPGRWLQAVRDHAGAQGAVLVTVAGRLSTSSRSAELAAGLAADAGTPVSVIDSGSAAGGEALVVLAAARAAAAGYPLAAVRAAAAAAAGDVRLVGALGSLDRLAASGRVPGVAHRAGRALRVQPLFELAGGRVRPLLPVFSRLAALDRLAALWRGGRPDGDGWTCEAAVSHALARDDAERLADVVRAEGTPCTVGPFGSALLAHAGAGTVGLSWRWSRDDGDDAAGWDTLEG